MNSLDAEEQEILTAFERGELKQVENVATEIREHRQVAEATFKSLSVDQIPLSANDWQNLQQMAVLEGISYPALVARILHKYVSGQLIEQ
ncbi:MAG: antitoxin [Cyanobacteria bacterium]|nr:antitoxin [Cyanobacteriota bacterium]